MKFAEINMMFSAKVAEYLNNGYVIHPYTMGGHQGEIAKVDLTNGQEIIRVWLEKKHCDSFHFRDGVALTIGRSTDERLLNPRNYTWSDTMWSDKLEVVEQRIFWQMVRNYREVDWFIEGDEGLAAVQKTDERSERKYRGTGAKTVHFDQSKFWIALKLVRKTPYNKTKRMADISDFWKVVKPGEKTKYYAKVKGYDVALAQ